MPRKLKRMEESHTAEYIAETLKGIITDWNIPSQKVMCVVHDNKSNMVLSTMCLADGDQDSWGDVQSVRCAGHSLQLCVNGALKDPVVSRTIAAGKRIVTHFKKSTKATAALAERQREQNVPEHVLIQNVATRWNSVYMMLERLLEQKGPVTAVLRDPAITKRADRDLELTTFQWRIAEDIVGVLRPMITLTELLSQDMNASLSATIPMLMNLKRRHLVVREDDSRVVRAMKTTLTEEIDSRWQLNEQDLASSIYTRAAILDPRFKKLSFFSDQQRDQAYSVVANLAESLVERTHPPSEEAMDSHEERTPSEPKEQVMAMLLSEDEEEEPQDDSEMVAYVKDPTKSTAGPLDRWRKNEDRYPKLSKAAKRIHCIPMTSTPSERIFFKAGSF